LDFFIRKIHNSKREIDSNFNYSLTFDSKSNIVGLTIKDFDFRNDLTSLNEFSRLNKITIDHCKGISFKNVIFRNSMDLVMLNNKMDSVPVFEENNENEIALTAINCTFPVRMDISSISSRLSYLRIEGGTLKGIKSSKICSSLEMLYISESTIEYVDFDGSKFPNLRVLSLQNNSSKLKLNGVDFSKFHKLKILDLIGFANEDLLKCKIPHFGKVF
jgi:Leucine-rich repeat (LRR) protein